MEEDDADSKCSPVIEKANSDCTHWLVNDVNERDDSLHMEDRSEAAAKALLVDETVQLTFIKIMIIVKFNLLINLRGTIKSIQRNKKFQQQSCFDLDPYLIASGRYLKMPWGLQNILRIYSSYECSGLSHLHDLLHDHLFTHQIHFHI